MEIKGLGIINVGTIFGTHAVREEMPVDIVVEFVPVEKVGQVDDAVSGSAMRQVMGVSVPLVRLPARHGSNMATVIEVLAKDYLAKRRQQGKPA
jgi:HPr kinase/phosphorylase